MRISRSLSVASVALSLLGAACTGSSDEPPATTAEVITTTTADPTTPTLDGTLRVGMLVPQTGSQAALGPALRAAAQLAVDEVNAAGGVLGKPVEITFADAGDATTDTAGTSVDKLSAAKVDVIIGPPSSAVTSLVLDKVARSSAVLISPGNPLADPPPDVPYLQLAPGLELLGTAVGQSVAANGHRSALIVARNDAFGQRVSAAAAAALAKAGVTAKVQPYNPEADVYSGDVTAALAAGPEQVIVVGYAELADFVGGFIAKGVLPAAFPMYLVSDRLSDALLRRFTQPGVLSGLQAVGVGADLDTARNGFAARLRTADPQITVTTFAAEAHDAVVVAALAAARSGSDAPKQLRDAAAAVTGTTKGEPCQDAAACLAKAAEADVTYRGQAGPYLLDGKGQPGSATFAALSVGADNKLDLTAAKTFRVTAG